MTNLDKATAVALGGWDARYAVVLAVATHGDIGAALIDTNGDGGDISLDQYRRGPDGSWEEVGSSGGAGDAATSWSPDLVAAYGRGRPGQVLEVHHLGDDHAVTADDQGWWLFIAPPGDDDALPEVAPATHP